MLRGNKGRGRQTAKSSNKTPQRSETTKRSLRSTEKLSPASGISSDEVEDQEDKKFSEPPKKRTGRQQPTAAASARKRKIEEDAAELADYSLVSARSRRTPKPNPKYTGEQILTSKGKSGRKMNKIFADSDIDSEEDESRDDSGEDFKEHEDAENSADDQGSDDKHIVRKTRSGFGARSKAQRGRPRKMDPVSIKKTSNSRPQLTQIQKSRVAQKRKADSDVETVIAHAKPEATARNRQLNIDLYDASDSEVSNSPAVKRISQERAANIREKVERQRALLNASKSEPQSGPTSVALRQALVQNALDASRAKLVADMARRKQAQFQAAEKLKKEQEMRHKKVREAKIETDRKKFIQDTLKRQQDELMKEKVAAAAAERNKQKQEEDATNALAGKSGRSQTTKNNAVGRRATPELVKHTATIDDFETMPTFTIVNINDIINKKEPEVIRNDPAAPSQNNRRKTMHTTILSDKIDTSKVNQQATKTRNTYSPSTVKKSAPQQRTAATNRNSLSADISTDSIKQGPRILNTVLAQKSKTTSTLLQAADDDQIEVVSNNNTKENKSYASAAVANNQRKLPQMKEKVVIEQQGNKIIKKITCFETWYVVKIPEKPAPPIKNILNVSLIKLGNEIKDIQLPSEDWSYRITLQKRAGIFSPLTEIYVGEIQEQNIREDEKHNYVPTNIMFRRRSYNPKLRMQFDRAIIFKNNQFHINLNGKNVRLEGAPQDINSLDEIQILLEIINEIDEKSHFIEHTVFTL